MLLIVLCFWYQPLQACSLVFIGTISLHLSGHVCGHAIVFISISKLVGNVRNCPEGMVGTIEDIDGQFRYYGTPKQGTCLHVLTFWLWEGEESLGDLGKSPGFSWLIILEPLGGQLIRWMLLYFISRSHLGSISQIHILKRHTHKHPR